jgi:hypothetical protein
MEPPSRNSYDYMFAIMYFAGNIWYAWQQKINTDFGHVLEYEN